MASENDPTSRISALGYEQYAVVHRHQLRSLGLTDRAIGHRVATGRLHPKWPGVYAVGRAELTRHGRWSAAVLTCGPGAVLSHLSAAVLWGIRPLELREVEISVMGRRSVRRAGIAVHRPRQLRAEECEVKEGIHATGPVRTLIDLAVRFEAEPLEAAVNAAIGLGLTSPKQLRAELGRRSNQPGIRALRRLLDARSFRLTESQLERLFIPIALRAGLPLPLTQQRVSGYRVDFHWPDFGLVVETDGGSWHRTAAQQTRDRRRDQAHVAAGLTQLRFTHDQVAHDAGEVRAVLETVARRLRP